MIAMDSVRGCSVSKPDIVNPLPNGWREEIKIKKHFRVMARSPGHASSETPRPRPEVWHEVVARDGAFVHPPHLKYRYEEPTS